MEDKISQTINRILNISEEMGIINKKYLNIYLVKEDIYKIMKEKGLYKYPIEYDRELDYDDEPFIDINDVLEQIELLLCPGLYNYKKCLSTIYGFNPNQYSEICLEIIKEELCVAVD